MRRFGGVFWIAIALVAGVANYAVKQTVQGLDDELNNVRRKTLAEQKQIHDLTAEWTYLNRPELLADLNRRYLGLVAIAPKQERVSIDDIPVRPAAPPTATTDLQTAAATALEPAPPAAAPLVPVAATAPAPTASQPAAPTKPKPASLDALFAQVAGDR